MSSKDEYAVNFPNEIPEQKIWEHLVKSEHELENCEFISAYNRLKKAKRLMQHVNDGAESKMIKQKYTALSSELNLKIIKHIQKNRTMK